MTHEPLTAVSSASAVILAGGRSRRMGLAKAALRFGATTILERLICELGQAFDDIVVVAAPREAESFNLDAALGSASVRVVIVRDAAPFAGPASALARGLAAARHPTAFACSCDLPLLQAAVAGFLCSIIASFDAALPEIDGRPQPLCAAYRCDAAAAIAEADRAGEHRLTVIAERLNLRRVSADELRRFDPQLVGLTNVNTPEDYRRALKLAGLARS